MTDTNTDILEDYDKHLIEFAKAVLAFADQHKMNPNEVSKKLFGKRDYLDALKRGDRHCHTTTMRRAKAAFLELQESANANS